MNIAQALGLFLSMYASIEGPGASVPYPGNPAAFHAPHTDTSQDILARFHIFASTHPSAVSKRAFNVADGPAVTWADVWPGICQYFDLKGTPSSTDRPTGAQWMRQHRAQWGKWVEENGLREGAVEGTSWDFMAQIMSIPFARDYDLSAAREIGFTESVDHLMSYHLVFERMKAARLIPGTAGYGSATLHHEG